MGLEIPIHSERKGEYHLKRESARRLRSGVLSADQSLHTKRRTLQSAPQELTEVFRHCRSTVNEEESARDQAPCSEGVKLAAVGVAPERMGLWLYRAGARPVLRGTFWQVSPKRGVRAGVRTHVRPNSMARSETRAGSRAPRAVRFGWAVMNSAPATTRTTRPAS